MIVDELPQLARNDRRGGRHGVRGGVEGADMTDCEVGSSKEALWPMIFRPRFRADRDS